VTAARDRLARRQGRRRFAGIGADAVAWELELSGVRPRPARRTLERILARTGRTTRPPRPVAATRAGAAPHEALLPRVAAGGRVPDASEQPRSRDAERPDELIVYGGTGRAAPIGAGVRPDPRDSAAAEGRRDAPRAVGEAGRPVPHATSGRPVSSSRTRCSCRSGRRGKSFRALEAWPALTLAADGGRRASPRAEANGIALSPLRRPASNCLTFLLDAVLGPASFHTRSLRSC